MQICHIITRFVRGGADENTALTCNYQVICGHMVSLVHGRDYHSEICGALRPGVTRYQIPQLVREVKVPYDMAALTQIYRLLKKLRPDFVHTHTSKAGIVGRLAAHYAGVPHIVHGIHILPFVNVPPGHRRLYLQLERWAARYTAAFIDVSEALRDLCLAEGVGDASRHYVVPSGMDVHRFQSALPPTDWRSMIDPSLVAVENPKFLLLAAALEPRKRQREFILVFREIARDEPQAVLLLAGEGVQRPVIESTIQEIGLAGRVVCLGHRNDLEQIIALAQVCLHTAMREGLPRAVIQYALGGRSTVAASTPGIETVIRDGETGYLLPVTDLHLMKEPVLRLLRDRSRREAMERATRRLDLSAWDGERMGRQIETIYETVIHEGSDKRREYRHGCLAGRV
jgi:glycosyltransferase involved in cell wall biosynthesis